MHPQPHPLVELVLVLFEQAIFILFYCGYGVGAGGAGIGIPVEEVHGLITEFCVTFTRAIVTVEEHAIPDRVNEVLVLLYKWFTVIGVVVPKGVYVKFV